MAYSTDFTETLSVAGARDMAKTALKRVRLLLSVARERQTLRGLTADQLADIGLDRETAEKEAQRSFWDAPNHWRRK